MPRFHLTVLMTKKERKLTYVKMAFQVLKLTFLACSMKQAFYSLQKQNIARD